MEGGRALILVLAGLGILLAGFYFAGDVRAAIREQMMDAEWWNPIEGVEDSLNCLVVYSVVMALWAALGTFLLLFGVFDSATVAIVGALVVGVLVAVGAFLGAFWDITFGVFGGMVA